MANLGIIFRSITKRGPSQLQEFFKLDHNFRRSSPRRSAHRFQIVDSTRQLHRDYLNRSTFGYVGIFNLLPDVLFDSDSESQPIPVKEFQKNLNRFLKLLSSDIDGWESIFSPRVALAHHVLLNFQDFHF